MCMCKLDCCVYACVCVYCMSKSWIEMDWMFVLCVCVFGLDLCVCVLLYVIYVCVCVSMYVFVCMYVYVCMFLLDWIGLNLCEYICLCLGLEWIV